MSFEHEGREETQTLEGLLVNFVFESFLADFVQLRFLGLNIQ
jgi:hypothetical protein